MFETTRSTSRVSSQSCRIVTTKVNSAFIFDPVTASVYGISTATVILWRPTSAAAALWIEKVLDAVLCVTNDIVWA